MTMTTLIADMALAVTVVLGLGSVAALVLRRGSPALRHAAWRATLAGVWLAPLAVIAAGVLPVQRPEIAVPVPRHAPPILESMHPEFASELSVDAAQPDSGSAAETASGRGRPDHGVNGAAPRAPLPIAAIVLSLWGAGALVALVAFGRDATALRTLLAEGAPTDRPATVEAIAQRLGLARLPKVRRSAEVRVPAVAGWLRPTLVLPAEVREGLRPDEAALIHELAHVQRGDVLALTLARLTAAVWWWHPLAWLMLRGLAATAEEAADDCVLALTGARREYAQMLTDWAERTSVAGAVNCGSRGRALISRVRRVLDERMRPVMGLSGAVRVTMALVTVIAVAAVGTLHVTAAEETAEVRPAQATDADDEAGTGEPEGAAQGKDLPGAGEEPVEFGMIPTMIQILPGAPEEPVEFGRKLDDFETALADRWATRGGGLGLLPETDIVQEGMQSGLWDPTQTASFVFLHMIDPDWSDADGLSFWMHSEEATGAVFSVMLQSDDPETEKLDFFRNLVKVDWTGWRRLDLRRHSFRPIENPRWDNIETIVLSFEGYPHIHVWVDNTVLRLDDMRLLQPAATDEHMVIVDGDTDWGCFAMDGGFSAQVTDPDPHREGGRSALWADTAQTTALRNEAVSSDWSDYAALNMWLHNAKVADPPEEIVVYMRSERPDTDGQDGYWLMIPLNWEGWKLFSWPLDQIFVSRWPAGWDQIETMNLYSSGYGAYPREGTTLRIDSAWLSAEPIEGASTDGIIPPPETLVRPAEPTGAVEPAAGEPEAQQEPEDEEPTVDELVARGVAAKGAGRLAEAGESLREVVETDADHVQAHWVMAWVPVGAQSRRMRP